METLLTHATSSLKADFFSGVEAGETEILKTSGVSHNINSSRLEASHYNTPARKVKHFPLMKEVVMDSEAQVLFFFLLLQNVLRDASSTGVHM